MPNVSEKKLKLLYLLRMLLEQTDDQHALSLPQMLEELEAQGIHAERKSLYDDLETLRHFGIPIETRKNRNFGYYVSQRIFSPNDLALLLEALREAPFLSQRRISQLEKKIATLCSRYQWEQLQEKAKEGKKVDLELEESESQEEPESQPSPAGQSVEELLMWAMERDVQVIFQRQEWRLNSSGKLARSVRSVTVSPWEIQRFGGIVRLLGYDSEAKRFCSFPLGEISQPEFLSQPREGEKYLPSAERLTLEFPAARLNQVASYFDGALTVESFGKGKIRSVVYAKLDRVFQAWLFANGPEIKLAAPKKAVEQFRERAKALAKAYKS